MNNGSMQKESFITFILSPIPFDFFFSPRSVLVNVLSLTRSSAPSSRRKKKNENKLQFTMGDGDAGAKYNAIQFCMVGAGEHVSACEIEFDSFHAKPPPGKITENGISKKCDFYSSRRYFIRLSGMTLAAVVNIESASERERESNSKVCASTSGAIESEIVIVLRK